MTRAGAISLVVLSLSAWPTAAPAAPPAASETRDIEIYGTTDLHGHLVPHTVDRGTRGKPRPVEMGGVALLGGFLANARARFPGRVLLVDGGDLMQGTLASNLTEGAAMIRALNQLGYAAAALGNHEFDYGPVGPQPIPRDGRDDPRGALRARMSEARFPVLSANVLTKEQLATPFVVQEVDGVKVGIVGATTLMLATTTMKPNVIGLEVKPLLPMVQAAARDARAQGAQLVVLVMHAGGECTRPPRAFTETDRDDLTGCHAQEEGFVLARELAAGARAGGPVVNAIVGGHSHEVITAVVDGIPFIQAGRNGTHLAHVSIEVTGRGAAARATGRFRIAPPVEICPRKTGAACASEGEPGTVTDYFGPVAPLAAVTKAIAADLALAARMADRAIGVELPEGLRSAYDEESPLGNYVADALRRAARSDVGVINGGGLRTDLPAGALRFGALYETLPFDNQVVKVELSGAELRRTIVHNLHSRHGFLSYAGLRVDARCQGGKVLVDVFTDDGKRLDPKRRYTVGTPDFLAHGGDDAVRRPVQIGPAITLVRAAVEDALRAHGGQVRATDPAIFDAAHPRVRLPGPRPLACGTLEPHDDSPLSKEEKK